MDDIKSIFDQILGSKEGMDTITQLMGMLTSDEGEPAKDTGSGFDIGLIFKLQEIMATFTQENREKALLKALRPMLSDNKREKVDLAITLLGIVQIIPVLKESGLLKELGL